MMALMGVETQQTSAISADAKFKGDTMLVVPAYLSEGFTDEAGKLFSWDQLVDIFDHYNGLSYEAMIQGRVITERELSEKAVWWERFRDLIAEGVHFGASKMFRNELVNYNPVRHEVVGPVLRTASTGEFYRVVRSGCVWEVAEERGNEETGENEVVVVEQVLVKAQIEPYGWGW